MRRLSNPKKMKLLEILISLIAIGVFVAAVIFSIVYAPGMTIVDVKYGFRFGFIDYFRGSALKIVAGIAALVIVLLFSLYWIFEIFTRRIRTLGPLYLILFFVVLLFLNGYYNVVNKFEGLMALNTLLAALLLFNCVYSFICYIKYVEGNSKEKE